MGAMKDFMENVWNLYCDGYSAKEIAERYGCSEGRIRLTIKQFCEFGMEGTR